MFGRLPARMALVLLVFTGGAAAYQWWRSPERQISRILTAVDAALTHDEPSAGLAALTAVAALQPHLAPEIVLETGGPMGTIAGRQEVLALAARVRAASPMLRLQWFDPDIELQGDAQATVRVTAQVSMTNTSGEELVDVHQVEGRVERRQGTWMVVAARRQAGREPAR
jgi:hypothetical protein